MLFQLKPSTAGASGIDNNNSIGTCQTGITNATIKIYEEVNNTTFNKIINTKDCSIISGVTEFTTEKTPRKGSGICGSSPPPPSNQMELKGKDDDDEEVAIMVFESEGKTDSSQTDNQMTSTLLLKEGPTAAESITNNESGETNNQTRNQKSQRKPRNVKWKQSTKTIMVRKEE